MSAPWRLLLPVGMLLAVLLLTSQRRPPATAEAVRPDLLAKLGRMERQARLLAQSATEVETRYHMDVYPIEARLLSTGRVRDPVMARQAAWAIVLESETRHLSPRLIAEVMKVENPWLVKDTVSYAGAVGWMQIMPFHASVGHPCGPDLTDGRTSVCYGADILRLYIGQALDEALRNGLLRYNGCVRTPGCERYAVRIMTALGAL